jgi:hypothetical protein
MVQHHQFDTQLFTAAARDCLLLDMNVAGMPFKNQPT